MRTVEGVPVDIYWLRYHMRLILGPADAGKFHFSNGWAAGFCKRWGISSQVRTEKKRETVLERLPRIRQFHCDIYELQRNLPQQCPIYGAFPPSHIWNMDQIPVTLCILSILSFLSLSCLSASYLSYLLVAFLHQCNTKSKPYRVPVLPSQPRPFWTRQASVHVTALY